MGSKLHTFSEKIFFRYSLVFLFIAGVFSFYFWERPYFFSVLSPPFVPIVGKSLCLVFKATGGSVDCFFQTGVFHINLLTLKACISKVTVGIYGFFIFFSLVIPAFILNPKRFTPKGWLIFLVTGFAWIFLLNIIRLYLGFSALLFPQTLAWGIRPLILKHLGWVLYGIGFIGLFLVAFHRKKRLAKGDKHGLCL